MVEIRKAIEQPFRLTIGERTADVDVGQPGLHLVQQDGRSDEELISAAGMRSMSTSARSRRCGPRAVEQTFGGASSAQWNS
ncbi:MAG: hypothetical protein QM661_09955 [Solimonas sp.]